MRGWAKQEFLALLGLGGGIEMKGASSLFQDPSPPLWSASFTGLKRIRGCRRQRVASIWGKGLIAKNAF